MRELRVRVAGLCWRWAVGVNVYRLQAQHSQGYFILLLFFVCHFCFALCYGAFALPIYLLFSIRWPFTFDSSFVLYSFAHLFTASTFSIVVVVPVSTFVCQVAATTFSSSPFLSPLRFIFRRQIAVKPETSPPLLTEFISLFDQRKGCLK